MLEHMLEAIYPDDSRKAQPIIQAQITWHICKTIRTYSLDAYTQPASGTQTHDVCGLATPQHQYK